MLLYSPISNLEELDTVEKRMSKSRSGGYSSSDSFSLPKTPMSSVTLYATKEKYFSTERSIPYGWFGQKDSLWGSKFGILSILRTSGLPSTTL